MEIVDAAFKVWGRNFYQKNSLSQLAKELKVSKPALYRHFSSKQALSAAMTERFLDDFAASTRMDFEQARNAVDADEGIFSIIRSIAAFFARDVYALAFSLINLYDQKLDGREISKRLKERGVDMQELYRIIERKYKVDPILIQMIMATLTFLMSFFHKTKNSFEHTPSEDEIQNIISAVCSSIERGLGYNNEKVSAIDFEKLENQVNKTAHSAEPEPMFRAVAEAVAEAGPWDASMEMVARRMGLSKSSLYGHFKNRKDMLRRLFMGEFRQIISFARQGIGLSANTAEQLYLGIYSIAVYLRSRPEILITLGWIRTRKLDLGKPDKKFEMFRLFEDVDIEPIRDRGEEVKQYVSHLILFLLINILMRPKQDKNEDEWLNMKAGIPDPDIDNNDIRLLFRFITLGLGGFIR
jgi:AcrR family transcriptional regulator